MAIAAVRRDLSQNLKIEERLANYTLMHSSVHIRINAQTLLAILLRRKEWSQKECGVKTAADELDGGVPITQEDLGLARKVFLDNSGFVFVFHLKRINLCESQPLTVPGGEAAPCVAYHIGVC